MPKQERILSDDFTGNTVQAELRLWSDTAVFVEAEMSNVKAMPGVMATTNQPNEALIQAVEDILSDAKAGILQSLLATGFRADGLRMTAIIPHNNVYEVVGSLECLKQTYLNEWTEPR